MLSLYRWGHICEVVRDYFQYSEAPDLHVFFGIECIRMCFRLTGVIVSGPAIVLWVRLALSIGLEAVLKATLLIIHVVYWCMYACLCM